MKYILLCCCLLSFRASGTECFICLTRLAPEQASKLCNNCSHTFHSDCLQKWQTSYSSSCPVCAVSHCPLFIEEQEQLTEKDIIESRARMAGYCLLPQLNEASTLTQHIRHFFACGQKTPAFILTSLFATQRSNANRKIKKDQLLFYQLVNEIISDNLEGPAFNRLYKRSLHSKTGTKESDSLLTFTEFLDDKHPLLNTCSQTPSDDDCKRKKLFEQLKCALDYNQLYREKKFFFYKTGEIKFIDSFSEVRAIMSSIDKPRLLAERITAAQTQTTDTTLLFTKQLATQLTKKKTNGD